MGEARKAIVACAARAGKSRRTWWESDPRRGAKKRDKMRVVRPGSRGVPNARFIVLDPNGEYAKAFADQGNRLRLFRVPPVVAGERALDVPAWLWSGHEWTAVAQAQPGAQRPLLMQGLRELKSGHIEGVPREAKIRRYLGSYSTRLSALLNSGTQAFSGAPRQRFECARLLRRRLHQIARTWHKGWNRQRRLRFRRWQPRQQRSSTVAGRVSTSTISPWPISSRFGRRSMISLRRCPTWATLLRSARTRRSSSTCPCSQSIWSAWLQSREATSRVSSRRLGCAFEGCWQNSG